MENQNKKKGVSGRGKRVIIFAVALILFLIVTNPAILWFLSPEAKANLSAIWERAFGNVDAVARAIRVNWVAIFQVIAIILLLFLIVNLVRLILDHVKPKTGKGNSIATMIDSFIGYAGVLVGIVWCLSAIGVNLSTIFASIGIVALIIGFAAESLIADIITGIFLVFEDEFNVGDVVEINGFRGTITSIGIRVTTVKDVGGNLKIINNSDIRDVLNRSKSASRAVCDMPISYAADLEKAEKVLGELLEAVQKKYPETFPKTPNYIGVQALDSSSVNLRVVAEVDEKNVFSAPRILNRELKIGFDKAGIEIPFQQVVVHQAND